MDYAAEKARQDACTQEALVAGSALAAKALAVSGVTVGAAVKFWPAFRKATGVSSRTALVVSPFFFCFFLEAELRMNACARHHHALEAAQRRAAADKRA